MSDVINISEKVLEIINANIENADIKIGQADEELSLLGMDSIKFISIVIAMEEAFEIEVPDEKLLITETGTLNKMIEVVTNALKEKPEQGAEI